MQHLVVSYIETVIREREASSPLLYRIINNAGEPQYVADQQ